MSSDAYQRAINREAKIWTPFSHSFPYSSEQADERVIVFGLYSSIYNNGYNYLIAVESQDLLNIVNDYNDKISKLTYEKQNVLNDIVTKRYLANIDKLIHDNKMITYSQKITAEEAEWTAKVAALSADESELTTLATKVSTEVAKTNARIAELQASISIESINQDEVDIEIAQKEIESAKKDLQILEAANDILKIQTNIVNAAMDLIEIDLRALNIGIQTKELERSIAKTAILESNLDVEQAQTDLAEAEADVLAARLAVAEKRTDITRQELDMYEEMVDHANDTLANKIVLMNAEQTRKISALDDRKDATLFDISKKRDAANFDYTSATNNHDAQEDVDEDRVGVLGYRTWAAQTIDTATINAAITAAETEITTQLTHMIQKVS